MVPQLAGEELGVHRRHGSILLPVVCRPMKLSRPFSPGSLVQNGFIPNLLGWPACRQATGSNAHGDMALSVSSESSSVPVKFSSSQSSSQEPSRMPCPNERFFHGPVDDVSRKNFGSDHEELV